MKLLLSICLLGFIFSCKKKENDIDCSLIDCMSSNGFFAVKFADKTTGADLVANGSFDTTGISVVNGNNNKLFVMNKVDIDSLKTAVLFEDNSKAGANNIKITAGSRTINFSYNHSLKINGCCGTGEVQDITVSEHPYVSYPWANYPKNFKILVIKL